MVFNIPPVMIGTLYLQGESPTYILNEDTQPVIRAIGVSHTACEDEFRHNIRSHGWSVFYFFIFSKLCVIHNYNTLQL